MRVLFASRSEKPEDWLPLLREALPQDEFLLESSEPVDVALVAHPPPGTLERLGRAKLIQSLWMGVEKLLADPALPRQVPLARLVDPGMVAAMSEMVLAHVLDWHRHLFLYRYHQAQGTWRQLDQKLASDRTVGILGLGVLGADAARKLVALGFNVVGYSRRPKEIEGVRRVTDLQLFLEQTPGLTGLDEKALLQTTLFGFPMLNVGLTPSGPGGEASVANPTPVPGGPGAELGLKAQDLTVAPTLTVVPKALDGPSGTVSTWRWRSSRSYTRR